MTWNELTPSDLERKVSVVLNSGTSNEYTVRGWVVEWEGRYVIGHIGYLVYPALADRVEFLDNQLDGSLLP